MTSSRLGIFASLAIVFCASLPARPAAAQETFLATLKSLYAVDPVFPFRGFDKASGTAPMPGAIVANAQRRKVAGTDIVDLSDAKICASPDADDGNGQGTAAFEREFTGLGQANLEELELLLDLDRNQVMFLTGYAVAVSKARSFTLPYDVLTRLKSRSLALPACAAAGPGGRAVVLRPLIGDVHLAVDAASPLPDDVLAHMARSLTRRQAPFRPSPDRPTHYVAHLQQHLIGIRFE